MTTMTRPRGVGRKVAHDPGDPLVTSHCPFCGSGQVVGRSDGTIGCDFCGQNYIVRVQPAFPGMPQMPMGPGAPSDVGPDGGLVDPGMVGPDGMPMGGEGPPPADAEGGEMPPDEGAPPPGGDEDEDAAPPKGKSKKASLRQVAVRRYNGLEGQPLTEDQFLRHVAVRASGADPRVMATLRADASRRTAASGDEPGGPQAWHSVIGGLNGRLMHSGEHHVMVGQHPATGHWFASIHPSAPEHQHMAHMVSLGTSSEGIRDRVTEAVNTPQAVHFMDSTMSRPQQSSFRSRQYSRPVGRRPFPARQRTSR
jgi:hypothetical protein